MLFPQLSESDAETHATMEQRTHEAIEARIALVTRARPTISSPLSIWIDAFREFWRTLEHVGAASSCSARAGSPSGSRDTPPAR